MHSWYVFVLRASAVWLTVALGCFAPASSPTAQTPAVIYAVGGPDDDSLNENARLAVKRFSNATRVGVGEFWPESEEQINSVQEQAVSVGFSPVIVIGNSQAAALRSVAAKYKDHRFTLVNGQVDLPNVRSVLFKEQESAFLVGMLAAEVSKSGTVGFVGGADSPIRQRVLCGFRLGVQFARPTASVLWGTIGANLSKKADLTGGYNLSDAQLSAGADVIFADTGKSGLGAMQAVKSRRRLGIGSEDMNFFDPETTLTLVSKNIKYSVFQALASSLQGNWRGGVHELGLAEDGVDWAPDDVELKLIAPELRAKIIARRSDIIGGRYSVHDFLIDKACPSRGPLSRLQP